MLCYFCPFFKCVLGVCNSTVTTPAHGLLGLSPNLRLRFISENASLLTLYVYATTHGPISISCWLGLCYLGLVTIHIFSFHVWPFTFMLQVTWINNIIRSRCSPVPMPRRGFCGLSPPNKLQAPPNWITKHYKSVVFIKFQNVNPPWTNEKPPYWKLSGDSSGVLSISFPRALLRLIY